MRSASITGFIDAVDFSSSKRPAVAQQVEPQHTESRPKARRPDPLDLGYKPRK
jgi:hypothetical protein